MQSGARGRTSVRATTLTRARLAAVVTATSMLLIAGAGTADAASPTSRLHSAAQHGLRSAMSRSHHYLIESACLNYESGQVANRLAHGVRTLPSSRSAMAAWCGQAALTIVKLHVWTFSGAERRLAANPEVRHALTQTSTHSYGVAVHWGKHHDAWVVALLGHRPPPAPVVPPVPVTTPTVTTIPTSPTPAPVAETVDQMRADILAQLNAYRQANGVAPLTESPCLDGFAQPWAEQLPTNFAHNATDPMWQQCNVQYATENIASDFAVDSMMTGWESDPAHQANMLDPTATTVGVGVYETSYGALYAVTDFGGMYPASPTP